MFGLPHHFSNSGPSFCAYNSWYADEGRESCGAEKAWKGKGPKELSVGQEVIIQIILSGGLSVVLCEIKIGIHSQAWYYSKLPPAICRLIEPEEIEIIPQCCQSGLFLTVSTKPQAQCSLDV